MGGYGAYLTRMSPIPVSAAWVRGDVESNERDVEDAVPYGQLRNVTGSDGRSVCGMVHWYRADALALRASPRGLAALV